MTNLVVAAVADTTVDTRPIPSAEAWFAGGKRVGYDPRARATIAAQDAPLKVFVRCEGDIAHAVTFLPGYPDGSFGWAKVEPQLPHAAEMPKLFFDYVGMGDSDKPRTMPIPRPNAPISSRRSGAIFPSSPRRSSPSIFPRLSSWSICDAALNAQSVASLRAGHGFAAFSSSMVGCSRTGTPIHGTPRQCCAACPTERASVWGASFLCSR